MSRLSGESERTLVHRDQVVSPLPIGSGQNQQWISFRTLGPLIPVRTPTAMAIDPFQELSLEYRQKISAVLRSRQGGEATEFQPAMNQLWQLIWGTASEALEKGENYMDCLPAFNLARLECEGGAGFWDTKAQTTVKWMYDRLDQLLPISSSSTTSSLSSRATSASLTPSQRSIVRHAIGTADLVGFAAASEPMDNSTAPPRPISPSESLSDEQERKRLRKLARVACIASIVAELKRQNVLQALCQVLIYLATSYEQCGNNLGLLAVSGIGGPGKENIFCSRIIYNGHSFFVEMKSSFVERHPRHMTLDELPLDEPLHLHLPNPWAMIGFDSRYGLRDPSRPTPSVKPNTEAILRIVDFITLARDRALTLPSLVYSAVSGHLGLASTDFERPFSAGCGPSSSGSATETGDEADTDRSTSEALPTRADTVQVHSISAVGSRVDPDPRPLIDPTLAFAVQGARKDKKPALTRVYAELLEHANDQTLERQSDDEGRPDGGGGGVAGSGGPGGSGGGPGQARPASLPDTAPGQDVSKTRESGGQEDAQDCHVGAKCLPSASSSSPTCRSTGILQSKAAENIEPADDVASMRILQNQDRAFRGTTMYAVLVELGLPIVWVTTAEMDTALSYAGTPIESRQAHSMSDCYAHLDWAVPTSCTKPHPDIWKSKHESSTISNVNAGLPLGACPDRIAAWHQY